MTPNDVIPEIRRAVNDPNAIRWSDAVIRSYLLAAEKEIVCSNPEFQYKTKVQNVEPVLLTSNTQEMTLTDDIQMAVVYYVAARIFSEDAEDSVNQRNAAFFLKLYKESL